MAVLPLLQFGAIYLAYGIFGQPLIPGIQWAVVLSPAIFSLIFAIVDRRALVNLGYGELPSAVLAFIPPIYLLVRCFTVGPRSIGALAMWLALQAAAVAAVIILLPHVLATAISGL